jgi:3-methyladenine DNA glycosylase/8-oxoguanine DNA glycosylase
LLRGLGFESERELEQRSEAWRPCRAYAAMYVWNVPIEKTERVNRAAAAAVVGSRAEQRI